MLLILTLLMSMISMIEFKELYPLTLDAGSPIIGEYKASSYPSCFTNGTTWAEEESTDIFYAETLYSCQELCLQSPNCTDFTWLDEQAFPFKFQCFPFNNPTTKLPCSNCVSGPKSCTCSDYFSCEFTLDNILGQIHNVEMELLCQDICAKTDNCALYSWFNEDTHPLPNTCFVFSSCDEKDFSCKTCLSGPASCEDVAVITSTTTATTSMPCDLPESQEHGDWFCPPHNDSLTCHLECHPGYVSDFRTVITCSGGLWSSTPVCVEAIGLITGNYDSPHNTVEVYGKDQHLMLPNLPQDRRYHSLDMTDSHVLLCGGYFTDSSCLELTPSLYWKTHSTTSSPRYKHSSISLLGHLHLMGGNYRLSTTEHLSPEASTGWIPGHDLLESAYRSCAAKVGPEVLMMTGGYVGFASRTVISYNMTGGDATRLHDMNTAREGHGCINTRDSDSGLVGFLVAGGYYGSDSSEMYSFSTGKWTNTGTLTRPRRGVRLAALGKRILAFGGIDKVGEATVDIFNVTKMEWSLTEDMIQPRSSHAVTGVPPHLLGLDLN